MGDLTKDFSRSEFACRCGCGFADVSIALVVALQCLREALGRPVIVTSGCRCAAHNEAEHGEPDSQHLLGKAADVRVPGLSARRIYAEAARLSQFWGYGVDDERGFVHLDARRGSGARWCYRDGRQVAWHD